MVNTLLSTPSSDHLLVPWDRIQPLQLQLLLELVDEVVGLRVHLLIVVITLRHRRFSIPFPHIRRSTKAILVLLVYACWWCPDNSEWSMKMKKIIESSNARFALKNLGSLSYVLGFKAHRTKYVIYLWRNIWLIHCTRLTRWMLNATQHLCAKEQKFTLLIVIYLNSQLYIRASLELCNT